MIQKSKVKEFALHVSNETRNGKFTRVSAEFYPKVEGAVRRFVRSYIHSLPSVGKTIK
tara:strand:+ start:9948 stop:10121 length:174 start_codon:yes stop_codon:yes gene_type:complete